MQVQSSKSVQEVGVISPREEIAEVALKHKIFSSPLRRALSTHFSQYKGLTAPRGDDGPAVDNLGTIYKDTSNGNQF